MSAAPPSPPLPPARVHRPGLGGLAARAGVEARRVGRRAPGVARRIGRGVLLAVGLTALIGAVGVVGHWARTGPYERDRLQQAEGARRHLREMQAQDAARIRKEIEQARAIEDAVQRDAARRQPAPRAMTLTRQPSEPLRR